MPPPQTLAPTAPDAQQGKSPEMLAFEAAQKLKAEKLATRKAEAERLKALPATQAKKWRRCWASTATTAKVTLQTSSPPSVRMTSKQTTSKISVLC